MAANLRHDRTARLLEARLETIAAASERIGGRRSIVERHVVGASAATRNAVALGLLSRDQAQAIWAAVARRHPAAGWCRHGPGAAV